jgi:hypothetical protein
MSHAVCNNTLLYLVDYSDDTIIVQKSSVYTLHCTCTHNIRSVEILICKRTVELLFCHDILSDPIERKID